MDEGIHLKVSSRSLPPSSAVSTAVGAIAHFDYALSMGCDNSRGVNGVMWQLVGVVFPGLRSRESAW